MKPEVEEGLIRLQALAQTTWNKAQALEDRRQRGLKRIRKFSLLVRIFMFWRLTKMRAIVQRQAVVRSHLVLMAIGMTRKVKLIRRKIRRDEELQNRTRSDS